MRAEANATLQRIERLLAATRAVVAPGSPQRQALRERLVLTTGLSRASVEWALDTYLELTPSAAELTALTAGVPRAARAHVILPANVFVAAHRALALALASSARVFVKPSRREPAFVEALAAHSPQLFESVSTLRVEPGDHVWAYGSDITLDTLRRELPAGAFLHAYGTGFGAALVDLRRGASAPELRAMARAIAQDTAAFDQRGCLSPRLVLALGEPEPAGAFAELVAEALAEVERRLPRGRLDPDELADARWYKECAACYGRVLEAGQGSVSVRLDAAGWLGARQTATTIDIPPAGRHLDVVAIQQIEPVLVALQPWLTALGCDGPELQQLSREWLPKVRISPLGSMQRPAFDGPVDLRPDPAGEMIVQKV
jgi:hypothetical protein